jgi:hypothetical protein
LKFLRSLLLVSIILLLAYAFSHFFIKNKKTDKNKVKQISHISLDKILELKDPYSLNVQPIFDSKCIACHSCYNSPCQLNLTSFDGVNRGANKINIYDFPKFESRSPTRLYIDAHSVQGWQDLGFFSVLSNQPPSLLSYMISTPPGIESNLQKNFEAESNRTCIDSTSSKNIKKFNAANPAGRMPLGFTQLESKEVSTINKWLNSGAMGPTSLELEKKIITDHRLSPLLKEYESFFNGQSIKQKIVARYLYEHLFLASIYFEEYPNIFFRLVRSKTKDQGIIEIGTHLPFDDPKTNFYYRLRPITNTIVHKSHIPFLFSKSRKNKWINDFLNSNWPTIPKQIPIYGEEASNPFKIFADIPVKARYEFFLENAAYLIMTFIKGPVCRGQTALNVINDHFWVLFLDPSEDVLVNSKEAYDKIANQMIFPSAIGDDFSPLINFRDQYWKAVETKFSYLKSEKHLGIESLWNGKNKDTNSNITIYRHFDSASVLKGLRGENPKTVWVLDYHVFESIYYNLSAGYNVFGPILHQLNSRLYMEVSRVASEDLFLSFLPQNSRDQLRNDWNLDVPFKKESTLKFLFDLISKDVKEKLSKEYRFSAKEIQTQFKSDSKDPKNSFLDKLKKEHYSPTQTLQNIDNSEYKMDVKNLNYQSVQFLPDSIILLVKDSKGEKLWTLIHNKDHYNVAMLLFEGDRRRPEMDTVDWIQGAATSYANLIIVIDESNLKQFFDELKMAQTANNVNSILKKYGLARNNPQFWQYYKQISDLSKNQQTNERGYIDLNRYVNL